VPEPKNHGTSGSNAPTENDRNELMAARTGEPRESGSIPSSSRAWTWRASSGSVITPSAMSRASSGASPRDW
jgi:hypothetical protein